MVFSLILNDWNVLAFLQLLDSEFQTMALYAKQFRPFFVFSRGSLIFNLELQSNLSISSTFYFFKTQTQAYL